MARVAQRPRFTSAASARTFEGGQSLAAYMRVAVNLAERNATIDGFVNCQCEPYTSVFTFNRWKAQGLHVKRGEKAIRHSTWIAIGTGEEVENPEGETPIKRAHLQPKVTFLFCRCQVE
jgi:hypothetical protein